MSQCEAFGLRPDEAAAEVVAVIAVVNEWRTHFAQAGVASRDIESLAERVDGDELLRQRQSFDPAQFRASQSRPRKTSPFRPT